jgi:NAD(P)-dependent dehydrogenase (short-subunit alcohol dehydrogenase family)
MGHLELALEGKTGLVTGAGRGLGYEVALGLARQGCKIAALSRTSSQVEALADEIRSAGAEVLPLEADASDSGQVRGAVSRVLERFGTIDILVNNAAVNVRKPCVEYTDQDWQYVLGVNLTGYFLFAREVGKVMTANRRGKVINVGSELGVVGDVIGQVAYATSKGGVIQLTRCLAAEWAPYGVTVNCIAPTLMDTSLVAELFEDRAGIDAFIKRVPLGRLPKPKEVADIILFLSSHYADAITGHVLLVDGGYTIV